MRDPAQGAKQVYEVAGPDGAALLIESDLEWKNRSCQTFQDWKKLLEKRGLEFREPNSVLWQFERKGLVVASPDGASGGDHADPEEVAILAGFEDVSICAELELESGSARFVADPTTLNACANALKSMGR